MKLPPDYKLIEHNEIDSTNIEAKRLIASGAAKLGNFIITAKLQTAGKGRLGRSWVSDAGNLFVSVILCPQSGIVGGEVKNDLSKLAKQNKKILMPPIAGSDVSGNILRITHYPFLAAIAIGKTLQHFINTKPLYKWPNDVLIEGKKISGVLTETIGNHVIIGMGINIVSYPEILAAFPATCLNKYTKVSVQIYEVLELLIGNLDKLMGISAREILSQWVDCAYGRSREISVAQGEKEITGIFTGIDGNGRLILDAKNGTRKLISFGDIKWI